MIPNLSESPSSSIAITFRCNCSQPLHARTIGFLADWISAYVFIKGNKERLVLYFLVSFLGTFLIIFLVLSIRLYNQKRRAIRLLKETAPLVSPISDISYEVNRDTTLDPLEISVPTSQTTLNHGPNHPHQSIHSQLHPHHNPGRLPSNTLASIVTSGSGGHTQTHLDGQYQPLLASPRSPRSHYIHHLYSSRQHSPHQHSHSVSPQRLSSHPDSSQLNSSSSPQPNTSNNSSHLNAADQDQLTVNSNQNSPTDSEGKNPIPPSPVTIHETRLYATIPPSSQRKRESSSPGAINSTTSSNETSSQVPISGTPDDPNQRSTITQNPQQPNEIIIVG